MDLDKDRLLEPVDAYNNCYKDEFIKNASETFEGLVAKSGISADENRRVSNEYRKSKAKTQSLEKKLSGLKTGRTVFIVLAVLSVVVGFVGFYTLNYLVGLISVGVLAISLALIFAVFNGKIKSYDGEYSKSAEETRTLYNKATELISPLLELFDSGMTTELIQKTVPTLVFDKNFDMRRYDVLHNKYGYPEDNGEETSSVGVLSGEIIGNPFVFEKKLRHSMGTQVYTGSLTIHWVTYEEINGRRQAVHHTETLHASVTKPKPFYSYTTDLVYGNDAAPDLSFSRRKTHAERFSPRELKSYVKNETKRIKKLQKKNIEKGFTELGNEEFDALFGALDRNHEVQFRLLFTPLAQKNLLRIIKGESPYGDDFNMAKSGKINVVCSDHAQSWNFNLDSSQYHSYDVDICKDLFLSLNASYFKSVFFDFAPLLSIPMYQQIKPKEFIYKDNYERNYTVRETEVMVNRIGRALLHPLSATNGILKTRLVNTEKDIDTVEVCAYSYKTVYKVDYVTVFGGDGHFHSVPVPWVLYVPLTQETQVELKSLDMSEHDFKNSEYSADTNNHTFYHSIYTTLGRIKRSVDSSPNEESVDISGFDGIREE